MPKKTIEKKLKTVSVDIKTDKDFIAACKEKHINQSALINQMMVDWIKEQLKK